MMMMNQSTQWAQIKKKSAMKGPLLLLKYFSIFSPLCNCLLGCTLYLLMYYLVFQDPGHKHTDAGHSHSFSSLNRWYIKPHITGDSGSYDVMIREYASRSTQISHSNIETAYTSLEVQGINSGRQSEETRPKNAVIQWIIRVC